MPSHRGQFQALNSAAVADAAECRIPTGQAAERCPPGIRTTLLEQAAVILPRHRRRHTYPARLRSRIPRSPRRLATTAPTLARNLRVAFQSFVPPAPRGSKAGDESASALLHLNDADQAILSEVQEVAQPRLHTADAPQRAAARIGGRDLAAHCHTAAACVSQKSRTGRKRPRGATHDPDGPLKMRRRRALASVSVTLPSPSASAPGLPA